MKKIILKKLRLLNFCGIREKEIEFGEDLTVISASNGKGKSTISRAISYVLFGTDEKGNALDIKTYDKDHNIIREIPHEATLTISVDGEEIELKRTLTDKWVEDKCTNTFKYFIDGAVTTAGDYKKAINAILDETPFAWIVNPSRFLAEDWKRQRAFLQSLVDEITTEDITNGDTKFDFVVESLKKKTMDDLLHHLNYQRKEVQKQLDECPIRLQELNNALPDAEDWEALNDEKKQKMEELNTINDKISDIKAGGAAKVHCENIRKQIEFQRNRIDQMEKSARIISGDEEVKHGSDLITARTAQSKAKSMAEELNAKVKGFTETEIQLNKQMDELKEKNKKGAAQYAEVDAMQWEWNEEDSFCPHCRQPLPIDKLKQIKEESEQHFNEHKAQRLKELMAWAGDIRAEYEKCEKLKEQIHEEQQDALNQMVKAQKALKEADTHLAEVQKETPRSYTEILNSKPEYQQAIAEVARLEEELNKPVEGDEEQQRMLKELIDRSYKLNEEIQNLQNRLAAKTQYDAVSSRIEEIKKNKETYQDQLDELDQKLDTANEFNQLSCQILEDRVNRHFEFVRFDLFKRDLNGIKKPFCECYHDGVPYSRLNGAAKVNAGIDIAYTISRFYDVSVPMVLDECESNLHPISRGGQQIRFYVTNDQELNIKTYAETVME